MQVSFDKELSNYIEMKLGDIMSVKEFIENCECGGFIDYDGHGLSVKDSMVCEELIILPSKLNKIPADATHIIWFNK